MTDERGTRGGGEAARGAAVVRWMRSVATGAAGPRARAPGAARIAPVHRSSVEAFWRARASVRAGIPLDDFLRARLARHLAALPVSSARLPLRIEVEDGEIAIVRTHAAVPPRRETGDWLDPLEAVEGPDVREEAAELEARLIALDAEIERARLRRGEIARALDDDVLAGNVVAMPPEDATVEQLGRPPVRGAAPGIAAIGLVTTALVAESWQVALPLLRAAGLDPATAGALRRPADVAFLGLFAVGVAAGIFALSHAALEAGIALFREGVPHGRRPTLAAGVIGGGLLAATVAGAVASLPARTGAGAGSAIELALLLVAIPLSTALLLRGARRAARSRAQELEAALAWDRERARVLGERVRRLDELARAEEEVRALRLQRDRARIALHDLAQRSREAARLAARAVERERAELARLAESIVAALELDRYEYVRQASARAAHARVARRPLSAAGRCDATPVEQELRVERKGRLAS